MFLPFEGFLYFFGLLVLPCAPLGVNPPSMPSSIIHPCNLSFVLGIGHCKLPSRWCSGTNFIGDSTISWSLFFCFFRWKQLEAVGSEPDEFHHRFSTMILGYFSMIVEEKRNVLYAYWHFHRSAKSLRAFGWFVGGASCAKSCFSGSTGPFSGTQYSRVDEVDQILLVGQVMENLIRISKRRRYEFPKSTTGSRRNVLDLFVQMWVKIGTAWSFFLLNISTHHWKRLASFGSQMMPLVANSLFCVCVLFLNTASWVLKFNGHWDLSEMYTSELTVSFSCRIHRSIIRDAQTHIVHRRLRCRCLFAAWLFWHACYLSFSSCCFFQKKNSFRRSHDHLFFSQKRKTINLKAPKLRPPGIWRPLPCVLLLPVEMLQRPI